MKKSILLLALVLAGCATDRTAQWQREVDNMIQTYGPACDRPGYSRSDDKWRGLRVEAGRPRREAI